MQGSEARRLAALYDFGVLDTAAEEPFDRLTALAAQLFNTPMALVSLIDGERQWFKSRHGVEAISTPRQVAFCNHAISLEPHAVMVVEDALKDPRFCDNPLVTGYPAIRFYIGAVLSTRSGENLGTLCVLDVEPRPRPSDAELARLQMLARIVVDELELSYATRAIREKQRLLELAEGMSGVGHWRYQIAGKRLTWSDEVYRIYGVDPQTFNPTHTDAIGFYHPDDQETLAALLAQGIEAKEGFEFQRRLIRPDGKRRHVACKAVCELDDRGVVVSIFGVFQDITDHVHTLKSVQQSERRYRLLADNMSDVVTRIRLDGGSDYISPGIEHLLGYQPGDMTGKPAQAFVFEPDQPLILEAFAKMAAGEERLSIQHRAAHKDGHPVWVETGFQLVRDDHGRPAEIVAVIRDFSDRKALEDELRGARAAAEAAAAVKADFLANMSHELRTPLTAVLGFAKLVEEQPELTATTRTYLNRVSNAGQALLSTVNDILDFSKLEAGQVDIEPQSISPADLARDTLELFTVQAGEKDLLLKSTGLDALPAWVRVDPDRVRQILLNLIGNAVKFTDAGTVALDAAFNLVDGRLTFSITDSGLGIPADRAAKLFQRFSQIDGSSTRKHGGTGLGLAICKGLAEAMGGEIGVRSWEGKGSCFWFSIPAPVVAAEGADGDEQGQAALQAGCRVLLVDDNATNRILVRAMLSPFDLEITEAENGLEAVHTASKAPFDVILMDLRMPGLDGVGAALRIRSEDGVNCAVPIIAFSADVTEERPAGLFNGAIGKPLTATSLIDGITKAIAWQEDGAPNASP